MRYLRQIINDVFGPRNRKDWYAIENSGSHLESCFAFLPSLISDLDLDDACIPVGSEVGVRLRVCCL